MSTKNVENLLVKDPTLFNIRKVTVENGFISVVNVENHSGDPQPSICIKEFILGQGSTSAANVEISLAKTLSSFIPGEVILEKLLVL